MDEKLLAEVKSRGVLGPLMAIAGGGGVLQLDDLTTALGSEAEARAARDALAEAGVLEGDVSLAGTMHLNPAGTALAQHLERLAPGDAQRAEDVLRGLLRWVAEDTSGGRVTASAYVGHPTAVSNELPFTRREVTEAMRDLQEGGLIEGIELGDDLARVKATPRGRRALRSPSSIDAQLSGSPSSVSHTNINMAQGAVLGGLVSGGSHVTQTINLSLAEDARNELSKQVEQLMRQLDGSEPRNVWNALENLRDEIKDPETTVEKVKAAGLDAISRALLDQASPWVVSHGHELVMNVLHSLSGLLG